nr:helix-turn-helix domain-containing protein [Pseudonocardia sp. C8]
MDGGQAVGRPTVERALRAGWRLDGWHTGFYLRLGGEGSPHPTATAVLDRALRAEGVAGALAERADGWAGWITADTEPPSTDYRLAREAVARALDAVHDEIPLVGGLGRPYEGRDGVARTLQEAREASLFAGVTPRSGRVEHVDGLGARRYLARWHQSDAFGSYARTLLAPLLDHADLLDTLHVYLDRESSATSAATALGIHRNTVNQRVERAQQLLAVDLTLPDDRLVVQLACRVLRGTGGGTPG